MLLLQDSALTHTAQRTHVRQSQRWDGLVSPHLAPSGYLLLGPVRAALHGRYFADASELTGSSRDVLRSRSREFYSTGVQSPAERW